MSATAYVGTPYVQVGALVITPGMRLNGVVWDVAVDGWDEPPSVTEWISQRDADHGGWARETYWEPRVLELKGMLVANGGLLTSALATLRAAVPSLIPVDITVAAPGEPALTASVRQSGIPVVERQAKYISFSFSLVAADPRRYDPDVTTAATGLPITSGGLTLPLVLPVVVGATTVSGVLTLTNAGDMPTRPVLTITGPCPPCTITHSSGRRLVVPQAVDAGRTLVIDVDARTALLDGTASRVVTGSWFDLEPGVNTVQFSSSSYDAAAQLGVSFRSAWR